MKTFRFISIIATTLIFVACSSDIIKENKDSKTDKTETTRVVEAQKKDNLDKEKILALEYEKKLELEKLKNQNIEKVEEIRAQKEKELKALEIEAQKLAEIEKTKQKEIEQKSSIEIAKLEQVAEIKTTDQKTSVYTNAIFFAGVIMIVWIILSYYRKVAAQEHERELKEKELEKELYMKEMEIKQKNLEKMFDIISDPNSDIAVKKEIVKFLSSSTGSNILEYKPQKNDSDDSKKVNSS